MLGYIAFTEAQNDVDWRERDWEAPDSLVWWVMRFIADRVGDVRVAEMLHFLADNQMSSFAFEHYSREQQLEIARVLLDELPNATPVDPSHETREHLGRLGVRARLWADASGLS